MLTVNDLHFSYKKGKEVLRNISFQVLPNEKICILGESGSGKSTLLKLIYAELQADKGSIYFDKKEIKGRDYQLIPGHEDIKYVPQDFDLEQYIPVREIVGKYLSNIDKTFKENRVQEVLKALNIQDLSHKTANALSGGQQQRVAIAKAVAKSPKLLLLDEPFSQLDASLHIEIRERLFNFLEKNKVGVIFTSHRAEDALGYSDKIILMKNGEIIQQDYAQNVYHTPVNAYVAQLFGQVNVLDAYQSISLNITRNFLKDKVVIYPEEIKIHTRGNMHGRVKRNRFLGKHYEIQIISHGVPLKIYHHRKFEKEEKIHFDIVKYRWVKA